MTVPTTPEAIIYEALMDKLHDLVLAPVLPIMDPSVGTDPPEDRKYLRVDFLPNRTERVAIQSDAPHRHFGIFQVTVSHPTGLGELAPRQIAGLVADYFGVDTKIVYGTTIVRTTRRPIVGPSFVKEPDLLTPVSVEYESYI